MNSVKSSKMEAWADVSQQFQLNGVMDSYDPRITPIRGDLADISLAGRFFAPHYAAPVIRRCTAAMAMILDAGSADGMAVSQLLHGEAFAILDISGDWGWGYSVHDGYNGYISIAALEPVSGAGCGPEPTHIISARAGLVFADASIKSPVRLTLPMGATLAVAGASACDKFWLCDAGFISKRHATPMASHRPNPVDSAAQLMGAPYLWGGRGGAGLDCSGLVQMVLGLAGIKAPRDSDQQLANLGRMLHDDDAEQRGDLIFFPGHVGIMADRDHLTHANAHWMQVVTEPLADVIARIMRDQSAPGAAAVLGRKRIE